MMIGALKKSDRIPERPRPRRIICVMIRLRVWS
jgi:hypothetical protein